MKTYYYKNYLPIICFAVLICFTSCSKDDISDNVNEEKSISIAEEIFQLVNEHRTSIGQEALTVNPLATNLASEHTEYMITQADISHDNFDERADRLFAEENAINVGENVASGQRSAQEVMESWLRSSGHRENIEGNFTHIGIAVIKNTSGTYYFTQIFLRKRSET